MQTFERKLSPLIMMGTVVLAVSALYWGRPVLMPLAVAILLTFLLQPVVDMVHRWGVRRTTAVIVVVISVSSILGGVIFVLGHQLSTLAGELPEYKDNIRKKVTEFRMAGEGTVIQQLQKTLHEIMGEIKREEKAQEVPKRREAAEQESQTVKPVPVVVEGDKSARRMLPSALGPLVELIATMGLVFVLVIFMLLRLHDLRNRMIRLVGHSRLSTTTKALDEAGGRISRYLLMQTIINATYGFALGVGLFFIGLPYVILLGFMAFLMRFIPYIGPWLGAILPISLSLAIFDGWMHPFIVIGVVVALELFTNMFMEPLLYGQSAGVSEVGLIMAIAFWTWVWGPVGLALATPLTVCFVVLCKYIPELEFIETLMGDEPEMDTRIVYYQRVLAMDQDEAVEVLKGYLKTHTPVELCDNVLIPALVFAKRDANRQRVTEEDLGFIFSATREWVESSLVSLEQNSRDDQRGVLLLGCPAYDEADEIALAMFQRLFFPRPSEMEVYSSEMLSAEMIEGIARRNAAVICVSALGPDALGPARLLCKRLRERCPGVRIIVGRWGGREGENREHFLQAGADNVAWSLEEAWRQTVHWIQIAENQRAEKPVQLTPDQAAQSALV